MSNKKRGQVWIETMMYTLITFALIGAVLFFAKPKIEEMQDKVVVEKSIAMMNDLNAELMSVVQSEKVRGVIEMGINQGELIINPTNEEIFFRIESRYLPQQPGEEVEYGSVIVKVTEKGETNLVEIRSNYFINLPDYDLKYDSSNQVEKTLSKAPLPYKIQISDEGIMTGETKTTINMEVLN